MSFRLWRHRVVRATKRHLDFDEVDRLANAAAAYPGAATGNRYRTLVLVLALGGLRWGEVAALTVGNVDLTRRTPRLSVERSVTEVRGTLVWGTPKNRERRHVSLPPKLTDGLASRTSGRTADAPLFTTQRGRVLRNLNFRRDVFDRACVDARLAGLTPRELRHTAASLAIASHATVKDVQRMLGHASTAMTLDVYAGLFDDRQDDVAERIGAAMG